MGLPVMTPEQRSAARDKANAARAERAALKGRLKQGAVTLAEALDEECAKGIKVFALIKSMPGIGDARARQLMADLGIAEGRKVSGLGRNQRAALEERFAATDA